MKKERKKREPAVYRIKLEGILTSEWTKWFEGLTISYEDHNTVLCGPFNDQSQLHGVLNKVRDLNLVLLSLDALDNQTREEEK